MLIGIMADSHENMNNIKKAVDIFNDKNVEYVLHAGDIISPITHKEFKNLNAKLIAVFGNNDGEKPFLITKFREIGAEIHNGPHELILDNKKILLMHEPYTLNGLEKSTYYDIIIYGHTHDIDIRKDSKPVIVNPGETGGWLRGHSTIVIMNLENYNIELLEIEGLV